MALALLYLDGGFHALQLQRVAHALWQAREFSAALRIQARFAALCSRGSAVFHM